jgi:trehalose 6-phosphate phosphatase
VSRTPPTDAPPRVGAGSALFLDFDGTLAEIADTPEAATVDAGLADVLAALARRLDGALAVVSGRPLAELDARLGAAFAGAGQHGAELRRRPGDTPRARAPTGLDAVTRALRRCYGADTQLRIEDKGASVALHYRQAPERGHECLQALRGLVEPWPALEVIAGKCVAEARARGADKGAALRALAREAPFAGRAPVFVGDDRTDEDGFAAACAAGGYGVKVGDGATLARYRCASVAEVRAWLRASAAAP